MAYKVGYERNAYLPYCKAKLTIIEQLSHHFHKTDMVQHKNSHF